MRNKLRRPLAFLLSAVMIVTMSGTPVHAVADRGQPETGLCEHHTAHTDDCGYTEETPGTPCGHEHTEDCYTEVTECVHEHTPECYRSETEDSVSDNEATPANAEEREPENCPHICDGESGCITEKLDCRHEHDSECGYTESTPGTPCTYVCEICNPQDSGEADEEPETGIIKQEQCSCLTLCTEGQINPDCPVCGAEDAGLSDCKGKAEKEDTKQPEDTGICKHHQEHDDACGYQPASENGEGSPCTYECRICPIEELIAALPDKVTEDNAEDVRARLDEIHALFSELTEGEQEQIDLSRCYALQEALDETNDPDPITESVEYQEASWDGSQVTYESKTETCTLVENSAEAVTWTAGWYAVSGTVTISEPITVNGEVHLILTDGCDLTAEKGIVVTSTNSLTIYAQTNGTGTLTATGTVDGNNASAGIGGSTSSVDSGSITIHGGVINATGSSSGGWGLGGAGIGGGSSRSGNGGSSGPVTIYGGTITANSGAGNLTGAGIGGGSGDAGGAGSNITIYGGSVTAASTGTQSGSAGIGGGFGLSGGGAGNNIQIYGGTINATGSKGSAGIGGGGSSTIDDSSYKSGDGAVTISGGNVTAVGGDHAAGIGGGGGYYYSGQYGSGGCTGGTGSVTISGGIVDASSPTDVYYADYKGDPIGNGGNTTAAATVNKTTSIVFENGAGTVCGNVTFDGSYNVPAGYTLNIPAGASLSGSGTLTGGGTFTADLSEDMVSVPTDLYYNGQDRSNDIKTRLSDGLTQGIVICGQTFAVSGWTVAVSRTDDLHYTATYTNESDTTKNFTKTITLQQSGTTLDGAVKTYNGETETKDFTASDTITVKATPTATGEAPANSAMFAASFTGPGAGQMAVFVGDTQVSEAVDAGADGTYTMTVSAADVLAAAGGPGTGITLTAKFVGNNNMADGAGTVDVSISAVAKIENGSTTTYVGNLDDAFKTENDSATITLLKDIERTGPLDIEINCTLNLGGHKISSSSGAYNIHIIEGANVIIEGEGEVISENSRALWVEGSATLEGGTFTSRNHNTPVVYVDGNETTTTLSVTGKNVVIREPTGSGIGLMVVWAKSIQLSSGTYSGWRAIDLTSGFFTLDQLLGHSGDTRYAFFDKSGELLTGKLNDQSLTGTVTVKPCDHSTVTAADNGNGTHSTPECPACGLAGVENQAHDWTETTPCTVCGAVAVAKVVNGSTTTYVGALADAFTEGNSGATVTLLSEVDLGSNYIEIRGSSTFTLDLNGQTVKTADYGAFLISGGSLTIQDSGTGGKIESSNITIEVKSGTLSIKSGTVSGFCGVRISGGTVNISGGVISGEEMGLWVHNSGKAVLSGGTLIGRFAVYISADASVTLKNLLAEGYAYHRNNLPVTKAEGWVDSNTWGEVSLDTKATLAGTVTVKKCNHTGEGVYEYTPNEGAETHAMTCLACGYAGAAEDCQYTYTPDSGGEHHITACQFCGRTKTEAHTYGSWTPEHNENAVTIRRSCENCGYTKTDGTFTAPAHAQTMQYGKPITLTCSSTLPDATFQWILRHLTMKSCAKWQNFLRKKNTYANAGISTRFLTVSPAAMISLP